MTDNPTGSVQDRHLTDSQIIESRIEQALSPESSSSFDDTESDNATPAPPAPIDDEDEESIDDGEADDADAEDSEPEPSEPSFETLEEISEALGLSPDEFLAKYKIKAKVDGEEIEASLNELKNGYQRDSDYRKKTMELAEHRKAFERESDAQRVDLSGRLTQVNGFIDNLQNQLLGEFQGINWNEIRATNPGEYAALVQDFQSRQMQLQQVQQASKLESEKLQQEGLGKQQKQYGEIVQRERDLLLNAIPDWKDQNILKAEGSQIIELLKERGFNDHEIGLAVDHRVLKMAYDLMKTGKVKTKAETILQKVKTVPKLVKPGSKSAQLTAKQVQSNKLRAKIKKTGGKTDDIAALLMERM